MHITNEASHDIGKAFNQAIAKGKLPADTKFILVKEPTGRPNEFVFFAAQSDGKTPIPDLLQVTGVVTVCG